MSSCVHSIFFTSVGNYNLPENPDFKYGKIRIATYGCETLKYRARPEVMKVCHKVFK